MAFKIDFSKMKKVSSNKDHTVLKHVDDLHEIKINHKALSPVNRKALDALPTFAEGGDVNPQEKEIKAAVKEYESQPHPGADDESKNPAPQPLDGPKRTKREEFAESVKKAFASGGDVQDNDIIEKKKQVDDYNNLHEDEPREYPSDVSKRMSETDVTPRKMADGGYPEDNNIPGASDQNVAGIPNQPYQAPPQSVDAPQTGDTAQVNVPGVSGIPQPDASTGGVQDPASGAPLSQGPARNPAAQGLAQPAPQQPILSPDQQNIPGAERQAEAIKQQGEIEAKAQVETAAALKGKADAELGLIQQFQDHYREIDAERQAFQQDIKDTHIDPNHYLGSMDTGQKILTGISLALGGLGGGAHGQNAAADFLNNQINRDIDAQKANLGTKETLLSANLKRYQNMRDAIDMTRLMMNDTAKSKVEEISARAASPLAQQRAQQLIGQLEQQNAPMAFQLSMRRALTDPAASGQGAMSPAGKIEALKSAGMITPEQYTQANKELGQAQEVEKLRNDFRQSFEDLDKKLLGGKYLSPEERNSAINAFAGRIAKLSEGRFNLEESKLQAASMLPGIESDTTRTNKQRRMEQFFDSMHTTPTLDGIKNGLGIDVTAPVAPSKHQVYLNWAKQNRNDPRAKDILAAHGQ